MKIFLFKKSLIISFFLLTFAFLGLFNQVFSLTQESNSIRTQVGNPPVSIGGGCWPTSGELKQGPLGTHSHSEWYPMYEAVDIANSSRPPVFSTINGKVAEAYNCTRYGACTGYGNFIRLSNLENSYSILYGHLTQIDVVKNQTVKPGDQIGIMGTTGNSTGIHLHFEFRGGLKLAPPNIPEAINPLNCNEGPGLNIDCSPAQVSHTQDQCAK